MHPRPINPNEIDVVDFFTLPDRPSWHAEAACNGVGPEIFFPTRGQPANTANKYCASCPVTTQCLDSALEHRDNGVWAGTSGRQRRKIRRLPVPQMEDQTTEFDQQESA